MNEIWEFLKPIAVLLPFLLLILANRKTNLKKEDRSRQCYAPILAMIFCIVTGVLLGKLSNLVIDLFNNVTGWIEDCANWLESLFDGALSSASEAIRQLADKLEAAIKELDLAYWAEILVNALIILIYLPIKRIAVAILKRICKDGAGHYEAVAKLAYEKCQVDGKRYLKPHMAQAVTLMKVLYGATVVFSVIGVAVSAFLLNNHLIASLYYPVFSVILVGEIYFFLDGERRIVEETSLSGEEERSVKICDYTFMREVLRRNFGDKLMSDNTSVNSDLLFEKTNDELIGNLIDSGETATEAYGLFMKKKAASGLEIDQNYLASGMDLLNGKSVVFNNPFYYDLIPYIFFPMNRTILRRKKVLIVLGRHSIENDVEQWCRKGLASVSNIPFLWNIGILNREEQDVDVGIVTRSSVHDLLVHERNTNFFKDVEFVVLIEPSRLIATAQVGLNSLVRQCRRDGKKLVFCSADKNCDGLVDALSHILMTSLEEVSATNKHTGVSSYMCWEADEEHLQHRMLPNLSRYLGVGTELSFTALKNQVTKTVWYGGEAFPVTDVHWIAKQYYYDLLRFADLPAIQSTFDEVFTASPNMWSAKVQENNYLTVEDESYNMYEVKRAFSTRSKNQGFVNVISTDYLLKDYMVANDGIFDADSKAIPNIVADYAHTERNVIYRMCLRLTAYPQTEAEIRQELALINTDLGEALIDALWKLICKVAQSANASHFATKTGQEQMRIVKDGKEYTFTSSVIKFERRYSFKTGRLENLYSIKDELFIKVFLDDLCSAEYVAEDETDKDLFLGTELRGHIFQKYLPGQFFTFGGKYYEMLRLTLDGRVLVRRAADHINGRPQYRQVRNYRIANAVDSDMMGECKEIGGIRVAKQYADIEVDTPAYWSMQRYNDFQTGKRISINGVPTRRYVNKQLLKITFSEEVIASERATSTMALLINEVFRTLYAENQGMIVAVAAGEGKEPLCYSLEGSDVTDNSIYIIEDSQMDIGLLVSVERNLTRIFSIICDYLEWHSETLQKSLMPPATPETPNYELTDEQREQEAQEEKEAKKQKGIRGFFRKIGNFFKKIFRRKTEDDNMPKKPRKEKKTKEEKEVEKQKKKEEREKRKAEKKLQREKKRTEKEKSEEPDVPEMTEEAEPSKSPETPETAEAVEILEAPEATEESEESEAPEDTEEPEEPEAPEATEEAEKSEASETTEEEQMPEVSEATAEPEMPEAFEVPQESGMSEIAQLSKKAKRKWKWWKKNSDEFAKEAAVTEDTTRMNIAPPKKLYSVLAQLESEAKDVEEESQNISEGTSKSATKGTEEFMRKAYHERYYLLFGAERQLETIDPDGALKMLRQLGFGKGFLEQARNGRSEIENMEKTFVPNRSGSHYCDFCGKELFGSEYEILGDGRERCMTCGRTAVKTEKEFKKIFDNVIKNLSLFFGITIPVPVKIQMVNAKKLHKELGKAFIPTGQFDGRILGVAIKKKKGDYTILLENGSPRMSATMTMVHELTHIWQYLNWDAEKILHIYGKKQNLEIYEGMAKWVEIQYAYLLNEAVSAKREEIITCLRDDPYGHGFVKYTEVYPLSTGTQLTGTTPFEHPEKPL